jgi:hypothetical protein
LHIRNEAPKMAKPARAANTNRPLTNQRKDRFMAAADLTYDRLIEVLAYEPTTGVFTWKRRPVGGLFADLRACEAWNGRYAGKVAGGVSGLGHVSISIDGKQHWAHRLAFLWMTGGWPRGEVDHKNCVKTDNRWDNLRDVDGKVNRQNIRTSARSKSADLPLGVYRHARLRKTPYSASVANNGRTVFLGYHATAEAAHEAYLEAKRRLHQGCTL